jgi:hypothetical protein
MSILGDVQPFGDRKARAGYQPFSAVVPAKIECPLTARSRRHE